jgi:hypothetical protein
VPSSAIDSADELEAPLPWNVKALLKERKIDLYRADFVPPKSGISNP